MAEAIHRMGMPGDAWLMRGHGIGSVDNPARLSTLHGILRVDGHQQGVAGGDEFLFSVVGGV